MVKTYSTPPWLDWFNDMSTDNMSVNGQEATKENGHTNGDSLDISDEKRDVGIAPGLHGDYVDPHLKAQREYESDYAKLALRGGHKGLLSMSTDSEISTTDEHGRRQKGCQNLSDYNKIAHQGGHKDLLKLKGKGGQAPPGSSPTQKTGHALDLLKIEGDQTPPGRTPNKKGQALRSCGDWYNNNNVETTSPTHNALKPTSPEHHNTPPIRDQRRSQGNCIVPGGPEEAPRYGKKRFESATRRQEAPFATNF